jgi:hypothetical protein
MFFGALFGSYIYAFDKFPLFWMVVNGRLLNYFELNPIEITFSKMLFY